MSFWTGSMAPSADIPEPELNHSRPNVITICGSTRFKEDHLREAKRLTLEGNVVLSCPFFSHSDGEDEKVKESHELLGNLHRRKIDMSDAIFVVNRGGYIGESTTEEIQYASVTNKEIIYMEPIVTASAVDVVAICSSFAMRHQIIPFAAKLALSGIIPLIDPLLIAHLSVAEAEAFRSDPPVYRSSRMACVSKWRI